MRRLAFFGCFFLLAFVCSGEQAPTHTTSTGNQAVQVPNYLQKASQSSMFIYDPSTQPCEPPQQNTVLLPLGSGFVVGIRDKKYVGEGWRGWKFLITAQHVVRGKNSIILRLNRTDTNAFTCFPITLSTNGPDRNIFFLADDVDLAAIRLPDIPNTDPTVFAYSMILDEENMKEREVGIGTEIFTVGYLWGYSGYRQNFPVTKFGRISVLTDENWFFNNSSRTIEKAYIVELQNTPGLSGAPVMTHGVEFKTQPFKYRHLPPWVVGVLKGLLTVPLRDQLIPQGLAAVEPGWRVKELMRMLAELLRSAGAEPELN